MKGSFTFKCEPRRFSRAYHFSRGSFIAFVIPCLFSLEAEIFESPPVVSFSMESFASSLSASVRKMLCFVAWNVVALLNKSKGQQRFL